MNIIRIKNFLKLFCIVLLFSSSFFCCSSSGDAKIISEEGKQFLNEGKNAIQAGNLDLAYEKFNKVIESDPEHSLGYYYRAELLLRMNMPSESILDFNKAIELDSTIPDAYNGLGLAMSLTGEITPAIKEFDRAIELDSNFSQAYINRGSCYSHLKIYDSAYHDFTDAIELNPNNPEAFSLRAFVFYKVKDNDRAIEDFSKAIDFGYVSEAIFQHRGNAFFRKGDFENAILDYDKVLEMNPDNHNARNNRAVAYDTTGQMKMAKADRNYLAEAAQKIAKANELPDIDKIKYKKYTAPNKEFGMELPSDWHVLSKKTDNSIEMLITREKISDWNEKYNVGAKIVLNTNMQSQYGLQTPDTLLVFWESSTMMEAQDYYDYQIFQKKSIQKGPWGGFINKTTMKLTAESETIGNYEYVLSKENALFYMYLSAPKALYEAYVPVFDKAIQTFYINDINEIK